MMRPQFIVRASAVLAVLALLGGCSTLSGGRRALEPPPEVVIPQEAIAAAAQAYVEKAMATATTDTIDITVSQVAAFLHRYGLQVCAELWNDWHWTPAPAGTTPVVYYVVRAQWAVAAGEAPHARLLFSDRAAAPYCIKVRAFDSAGLSGPWSLVGWSDGGDGSSSLAGLADD